MFKKLLILVVLILTAGSLFMIDQYVSGVQVVKFAWAFTAVAVMYAVFAVGMEEVVVRRIANAKTRYTLRKAMRLLFLGLSLVLLVRIFIPNPEALLVAYGLMGAGVAIALQDLFKNFAGSITLFISGAFSVGDRIEVNGTHGDVVDIGLFYTTLLEIREWVDGDQASGRLLSLPNGVVLNGVIKNYTKHYPFLWDEIQVIITNDSDWRAAMHILGTVAYEQTQSTVVDGRESLTRLRRHFYIDTRSLEPVVYMKDHENGTQLSLRYVVGAAERRQRHSELWETISEAFANHSGIALAPVTFASVSPPTVSR